MRTETGGPAFPCPTDSINQNEPSLGMTLRDWFAGMALQALKSSDSEEPLEEIAYDLADKMIQRRKHGETAVSREVKKIISMAYRLGAIHGMCQFAWMKNGVSYVGTGGTTLRYAIENFEKMPYSEENELVEFSKSKAPDEIVRWLEEKLKVYQYS